jgi:pyruvate dehydrogenase E2 component (dihydrolipoamide acetyltransferase)
VPDANVQYADAELYRFKRADVSVAVAVPGGLVTPVVRDSGAKPVSVIAVEMKGLVERARLGKLSPHEYEGGTASLSNLGMYGVKQFEAIINPPQALIIAVGASERRAIVVGRSELQAATIMSVTGSFDHRAIDGAVGAQFMAAFKDVIERPHSILL